MRWDLGLQGLGVLALISLGFGVIAQLLGAGAATRWLWLIAAAGYFVVGLLISEVWFGWATEEDLQPNIDGLSFDEVLLGFLPGIAVVLVIRHRSRRRRSQLSSRRPESARVAPSPTGKGWSTSTRGP